MNPSSIDFHCHLDLYPDHTQAFNNCEELGVNVLAVTTTPLAWPHNHELAAKSAFIRVGLGLHPQVVVDREMEIERFEELAVQAQFIGEVGLDAGPRFYRSLDAQRRVFERVLRTCSMHGPKVLSIHAVRAVPEVLKMLKEWLPISKGLPILHWFSGTPAEAVRALDVGCWFSINPSMAATANGLKIIDVIPIKRMLTETDGPFARDSNGAALQPGCVDGAIKIIASRKNLTEEQVHAQLLENLKQIDRFVGFTGIYETGSIGRRKSRG
jgi:TatD DNase family protein